MSDRLKFDTTDKKVCDYLLATKPDFQGRLRRDDRYVRIFNGPKLVPFLIARSPSTRRWPSLLSAMVPALLPAFRDNDLERANRFIRKHLEGSIS